MEGILLESAIVPFIEKNTLDTVLQSMIGTVALPVSAYSAVKKNGMPFYIRARRAEKTGEVICDVPIRNMEITKAELVGYSCADGKCVLVVRFGVGSGTYIRSLAEEIGKRLGYPATLKELRRTKIGDFCIENARQLRNPPCASVRSILGELDKNH